MKKKLCIAVLAMCMAASAIGCGGGDSGKSGTESTSKAGGEGTKIVDVNVADYVKLGDYKGIELTKESTDVTDEQVEATIESDLKTNAQTLGADEPAELGDIVNIDYVGTIDGEEFDGGSTDGQGTDLELGSGSYIEGFEDQLVGAKTGETREVHVTFPEDYGSEELANKAAVFTVTVNSVKRPAELTDEWVAENTDMKTVDEYRQSVIDSLQQSAEASSEMTMKNTAWNQVVSESTISEYPEDLLEEETELVKSEMESQYQAAGMELTDFLDQMGMTEEDYDAQCTELAKTRLQMILIAQDIIDKEGLSLDDEAYDDLRKDVISSYGADDEDSVLDQIGEERFNQVFGVEVAKQFIYDNAKIDDGEATPAAEDETPQDAEETEE